MQSRAADFGDRLGHEGRVHAITASDGFDGLFERHQAISRSNRFIKAEVDFMLARCHLVMRGLDFKAHFLQGQDDFAPDIFTLAERFEVEIRACVIGQGGGIALVIVVEQEKFAFRANVEDVAHLLGLTNDFPEDLARVAGKGLAFERFEIADQPGHFTLLRPPGENQERVQVWLEVHVGFLDPGEPFDRRSIKHADAIEGLVQLA